MRRTTGVVVIAAGLVAAGAGAAQAKGKDDGGKDPRGSVVYQSPFIWGDVTGGTATTTVSNSGDFKGSPNQTTGKGDYGYNSYGSVGGSSSADAYGHVVTYDNSVRFPGK
ncbi:hypothetical protein [Cryptosporangium phraense]|uniref:Uncharacterized protein n=1 Tax=Cryptosporangium phraense TaxID=2593070 RepID=A0A545AM91_9ACTN|nr:hypothetical protein [Cryptosporangium phraense]TQS42438.1 hypothetical protein FL583_24330 [Cryptosporangium phraense]